MGTVLTCGGFKYGGLLVREGASGKGGYGRAYRSTCVCAASKHNVVLRFIQADRSPRGGYGRRGTAVCSQTIRKRAVLAEGEREVRDGKGRTTVRMARTYDPYVRHVRYVQYRAVRWS